MKKQQSGVSSDQTLHICVCDGGTENDFVKASLLGQLKTPKQIPVLGK